MELNNFPGLEAQIASLGIRTTLIASASLFVLAILGAIIKKRAPKLKLPLFLAMAFALVGTTVVLLGSTVYLNMNSESGGPVHWHADIEFWACGAELELRNPHGWLSNKIGSSTYHEHNDKRIHLEGVVVSKSKDASLEKFMGVTGGYVNGTGMGVPLNESPDEWLATGEMIDGDRQRPDNFPLAKMAEEWITKGDSGPVVRLANGKTCPGESEPAQLQAFVYRFNKDSDTYVQEKLAKPAEYVLRNESVVPPGDCLVIEYGPARQTTDKLCEQYGVRDSVRCVEFGVKEYDSAVCNIREVGRSL